MPFLNFRKPPILEITISQNGWEQRKITIVIWSNTAMKFDWENDENYNDRLNEHNRKTVFEELNILQFAQMKNHLQICKAVSSFRTLMQVLSLIIFRDVKNVENNCFFLLRLRCCSSDMKKIGTITHWNTRRCVLITTIW